MSNALKELVKYNDVFADLMNGMMFHGKQVIDPDDLEDVDAETLRNTGEDVPDDDTICKFWKRRGIILRLTGFDETLEMMRNELQQKQKSVEDKN